MTTLKFNVRMSREDVDAQTAKRCKGLQKRKRQMSSMAYIERDIALLRENMRWGTARNLRRALSSFASFLGGRDVPVGSWDSVLMEEYASWLRGRRVARNTVSFYMRELRAVYNKAVREGLASQAYPFRNVYTGIDRTRNRAVDEDVLVRMACMDLSASAALELARDMFLFSYGARGMAFVDMAYLLKSDVREGTIFYTRRKTGQKMSVRVEPFLMRIMLKYRQQTEGGPYVFPVLKSMEEKDGYRLYQTALGYYNRKLKRISRMLGLDVPLSSYVARHTWATVARDRDVPLQIISSGMGHTSERTTRIYLASLDVSVIDRVNSGIVAPLNDVFPML